MTYYVCSSDQKKLQILYQTDWKMVLLLDMVPEFQVGKLGSPGCGGSTTRSMQASQLQEPVRKGVKKLGFFGDPYQG